MEISPFNRELPLVKALPVPFWEVTIVREMRQFKSALGLSPNVSGTPSVNILACIVFGRRSFEAIVRKELGDAEFRNLRNYALGKVKNPRALGSVLSKCGGDEALLDEIASVLRDPSSSNLVRFMAIVEGLVFRLTRCVRSIPIPCPCCGVNQIISAEEWWGLQPCDIGAPEAALIDRACLLAVAVHFLVSMRNDSNHLKPPTIRELANDSNHPYGNWLRRVARVFNAAELSHLAVRAGADIENDSIWRYARGEMLTPEVVEQITAKLEHAGPIRASVISARTLAFAIEFLRATHRQGVLDEKTLQRIVSDRVETILNDLMITLQSARRGYRLEPRMV